jgi:hypothetical protein
MRTTLIIMAILCISTVAVAEDYTVDCVAGVCTRWVSHEVMSEAEVIALIAEYDSEITFLNSLPSISVSRARIIDGIFEKMELERMNWDDARQERIDTITAIKTALENRTTTP